MLQTQLLTFAYNQNTVFQFPNISLSSGEDLLILGPSGIGKTTMLHLLAGLLTPKSGKIMLQDTILTDLKPGKMDRFRGKHIGLVFQQPHFIHSLTLHENLLLMQALASKKKDTSRIKLLLEDLNLSHKKDARTYALSHGERQRAAIAIAVLNQPHLILADEPTSSLDDNNCHDVINLLKAQAHATTSNMVIITHDHRLKPFFKQTIEL